MCLWLCVRVRARQVLTAVCHSLLSINVAADTHTTTHRHSQLPAGRHTVTDVISDVTHTALVVDMWDDYDE